MDADTINKAVSTYPDTEKDEIDEAKNGQVMDAFGDENGAAVKYKTLKWWYVFGFLSGCLWWSLLIIWVGNVDCVSYDLSCIGILKECDVNTSLGLQL